MTISNNFLEYVLDQFPRRGEVTARKMFGGAGLYRDSMMFALISDNVVYLKVNKTNKDRFFIVGSSPFKPLPNRPTILPYFEAPRTFWRIQKKLK